MSTSKPLGSTVTVVLVGGWGEGLVRGAHGWVAVFGVSVTIGTLGCGGVCNPQASFGISPAFASWGFNNNIIP